MKNDRSHESHYPLHVANEYGKIGGAGQKAGFRPVFDSAQLEQSVAIALERLARTLRSQAIEGVQLEDPRSLMSEMRMLMKHNVDTAFDPQRFGEIVDLYLRTGIKVHSKGYMARQFSSVVPVSATFDLVTAMAPQPASFYEAGQLANIADKIIAEEFGRLLGWAQGSFDMVTTSGGSLANLTAILAARNAWLKTGWKKGVAQNGERVLAIATGEDVHYSVARVPGIIGIGSDNIIRLPLNEKRQICPVQAIRAIREARENGYDVFCIVASSGSTSVGAIDPLDALADFAAAEGIWLHVDGAHGGAFLVSDQLRPRVKGLERADSLCIDAHKTLFVPGVCTLLFYRDKDKAETAFAQKASYVFDKKEDIMVQFESGSKNFECTKRPSILNLWLVWALYGRSVFAEKLDYLVDLTMDIYHYLSEQPDFTVIHQPEANILCFEHSPPDLDPALLSTLQLELRDRIRAEGRYFLSKVEIDGRNVLRLVMMNHEIDLDDVIAMLDEVRRLGDEITAGWSRASTLRKSSGV